MPSRHLLNALSVLKIITYGKLFLNNPSYLASDEKGEYAIIMLTDILILPPRLEVRPYILSRITPIYFSLFINFS